MKSRKNISRRSFMHAAAGTAAAMGGTLLGAKAWRNAGTNSSLPAWAAGSLKKAACIGVFPKELSVLEKFKLAQKAGFEGIEPNTIRKPEEVQEYKEASQATGVKIHSIMNSDHWNYPLSDSDPEVVKKCIDGIKTSLQNAHDLGAETVLLVPAVVTSDVRYIDAYK